MLELKTPPENSTRFFLIAALLFLAPRIGWMLAVDAAPMSDQLWYFERAVGMLNGEGYAVQGQPTAFWPIGYPAFLAGLFAVFGPSVEVAKAANLVLSGVAMVFVYRIARRAAGSETAARAALLLAALYPTQIVLSAVLAFIAYRSTQEIGSRLTVPFFNVEWDLGWAYIPVMIFAG